MNFELKKLRRGDVLVSKDVLCNKYWVVFKNYDPALQGVTITDGNGSCYILDKTSIKQNFSGLYKSTLTEVVSKANASLQKLASIGPFLDIINRQVQEKI